MKRTTDTRPEDNRRALLVHHDAELLADPKVVAFLDNKNLDGIRYRSLERKFVRANEPALLVELVNVKRATDLQLCEASDLDGEIPDLPDGFFEYIAERINQMPSVTSFTIAGAALTLSSCSKLHASLQSTNCKLTTLAFANCHFADAHTQFPGSAPTITELLWENDYDEAPAAPEMDRILPVLAGWQVLENLTLKSMGEAFNFALVTRALLANPKIDALNLIGDTSPDALVAAGQDTPHNPSWLFGELAHNRTGLIQLAFQLAVPGDNNFNNHCIQQLGACLAGNTTLQSLHIPGMTMCTAAARQRLEDDLKRNQALTNVGPSQAFYGRTPPCVVFNEQRQFLFSRDFLLGAMQAFVQMQGAPADIAARMTQYMSWTPHERTYCAAVLGQLCKTTNKAGITLRSAGLRISIEEGLRAGDMAGCQAIFAAMTAAHIALEPDDKRRVLQLATRIHRLDYLPVGYAR